MFYVCGSHVLCIVLLILESMMLMEANCGFAWMR